MSISLLDIGSNSVRYMEAWRDGDGFAFSPKQVFTTRLANGLAKTGLLSQESMDATCRVVAQLKKEADEKGCPLFAYATSAVRDAANQEAFLNRLTVLMGRTPDVLSGQEEARFARLAAGGERGGFLEIGGGSTQIALGDFVETYPFGCVRARDLCLAGSSFPALYHTLSGFLSKVFMPLPEGNPSYTGAGGTITTLAALEQGLLCYDPLKVQGAILSKTSLYSLLCALGEAGEEGRRNIPLLSQRHDVILHGGAILLYLMDQLALTQISVSDRDGMEGYAQFVLTTCV